MDRKLLFLAIIMVTLIPFGCASIEPVQMEVDSQADRISAIEFKMVEDSEIIQDKLDFIEAGVDKGSMGSGAVLDRKDMVEIQALLSSAAQSINKLTARVNMLESRKVGSIKVVKVAVPTPMSNKTPASKAMSTKAKPMAAKSVSVSSGLRMKILTATGKISSAKRMSRKLKELGYEVERVDRAPSKSKKSRVFYSSGNKEMAIKVAEEAQIGGGTRPISWKSVFDIIIVVGADNG